MRSITSREEDLLTQERRGRTFMSVYAVLAAVAMVSFVGLAVFVREEDVVRYFDAPVAQAIQNVHWPPAAWLLIHMSDLGFFPFDVLCVTSVAVVLYLLQQRIEAFVLVASVVVAGELGTLAKDVVQRSRPTSTLVHLTNQPGGYSFPSGHVIFASVLFGTAFWLVWITWHGSILRNAVLVGLSVLVVLMGPSRIYLGAHWPTDVIGAYALSALWVAGTVELILMLKPRLSSRWSGRRFRRELKPLL